MPRSAEASLQLQHSESVVVNAASRIFAARIATGQVTPENEQEVLSRSIRLAIRLGLEADRILQADEEEW
jgi:hypothetical protein